MRRGFPHHRWIMRISHRHHTHITGPAHLHHGFFSEMEVYSLMETRRIRWNTVGKSEIPLVRLIEQYLITGQTEEKTPSTLRGYQEELCRFIRWCEELAWLTFRWNWPGSIWPTFRRPPNTRATPSARAKAPTCRPPACETMSGCSEASLLGFTVNPSPRTTS